MSEGLLRRADEWAALMESRGERVIGPRRLMVRGREVRALRRFSDFLGNVTAFTDEGVVVQYLRHELAPAWPLEAAQRWTAGLAIMKDQSRWPLRRVLALVRATREGDTSLPEVAFLVRGRGPRLYPGDVSELDERPLHEQLEERPALRYVSFEALAADGWRVD